MSVEEGSWFQLLSLTRKDDTPGQKDGALGHGQWALKWLLCFICLWQQVTRQSFRMRLTHSPLPERVAGSLEWHCLRWRSHAQPCIEHSGWGGVTWKAASAGPSVRSEAPCRKLPSPAVSHAPWCLWRTRGKMLRPALSIPPYPHPTPGKQF